MWADVQFLGELTHARVPGTLERCREVVGTPPRLIVDLTRVTLLDDSARDALINLTHEFTTAGGDLRIVTGDSPLGFELTEVSDIRVWESVEAARGDQQHSD